MVSIKFTGEIKPAGIDDIEQIIRSSDGRFMFVQWVKKNGELREATARLGVKKHLVHGGKVAPTTAHIPKYIVMWDAGAVGAHSPEDKGYRNINMETVKALSVNGVRYEITQ